MLDRTEKPRGVPPSGAAPTPGLSRVSKRGVNGERFIAAVQPFLARDDLPGLVGALNETFSQRQICGLLSDDKAITRQVAALALSLVGDESAIPQLVARLRDPEPAVSEMSEHALWSIWLRGGTDEANARVVRGSEALDEQEIDRAREHFTVAIKLCPNFAEARNQRALANYLSESFDESIADGLRAVELMPCHFGAWAGLGHCHAQLGDLQNALQCYRQAVEINPRLDCVVEMIHELESGASKRAKAPSIDAHFNAPRP